MKKKQSKNIYYKNITLDNLYNTWLIVKKTCKNKKELYKFSLNLNTNLYNIYNDLLNKKYVFNKYKTFLIFEPKERLVMSQSIRDKIVNHFVTNYYLIPYLKHSLIDSNVATRKNKGSSYARNLLKKYINKLLINNKNEIYCLKLDISRYFYNIDHKILINKLSNKLLDKDVLELLKTIISNTNKEYINNNIMYYNNKYKINIPCYINNKGLSIGAMSSQFLAIFYLNDLDHYIKEELKCKYYIRYMDDFIILSNNKKYLKNCYTKIEIELNKLKLNINKKSNIYRVSNGFNFLGYKYKIINNKLDICLTNQNFHKIINRLFKLLYKEPIKYYKSHSSYYGYFKTIYKLKGHRFNMKIVELYNLYKEKYPNYLILIKEGIFYKSFNDDAIIIWYIFGYKLIDNHIGFSSSVYNKVIDKLKEIEINFLVIDKDSILLINNKDEEVYNLYLKLSIKKIKKKQKEEELINKIKSISDDNYDKINEFLDNLK